MADMTAAVLYGKEDVRIERIPMPRAGKGEIVVRIHAALTCGTDLKVYRRGYHARMLRPPTPFGHELAGIVAEIGPGVTNFQIADQVVALNSAPCDNCYFCRRDQENLCDDLLFNNGAYAEYIRVPARIVAKNTLRIPAHVKLEHAAMTEPLACVLQGMDDLGVRAGDSLAVIGAGAIGLMFIHLAALMNIEVIAVVKRDEQAKLALTLGAKHVVYSSQADAISAVRALTQAGRGTDSVVEAVATAKTWQAAVEMARKGGAVNFFGGCAAGTKVDLDTNRLHYNSLTLHASFHHRPSVCRRAFEWIAGGRFAAEKFITGHAPLADLVPVFERLMQRTNDVKTVILPGEVA